MPSAAAALRRLRQALVNQPTALLFLTTSAPSALDASTGFDASVPSPNYPPGFALDQAAAVRLAVQRERWQRAGSRITGYSARVTVLRNRWGRPGQETTIHVTFDGGIQNE
jgi:hypothetical protein